jgi:hypothetical protein
MEELASERQAVRHALEQIKMKCFVYENDAGARPVTAEKTFLTELQKADLYIGIFWKGYGKYTVDEFKQARSLLKPCFIYNKYSGMSDRDPKLVSFLDAVEKVTTGLTVRRFKEVEELADGVQDDLMRWIASKIHTASAPGLEPVKLPCLCDRDPQEKMFRDQVLKYFDAKRRRPVLIVLNGHRFEGHQHYIDRVEGQSLYEWLALCEDKEPKLARSRTEQQFIEVARIPGNIDDDQVPVEFGRDLQKRVAAKTKEPYTEDTTFLARHIRSNHLAALIVVLTLHASEYTKGTCTFLRHTCEYITTLADSPQGTLLSFVVCIKKWETRSGRFMDILARQLSKFRLDLRSSDGDAAIEADLAICRETFAADPRISFIELPALMSITPAHVDDWLSRDEVRGHVSFGTTNRVKKIFNGRPSLPMDEACEELLALLNPQALTRGVSG